MSDTLHRVRALVRAQTVLAQIELRSKATQGAFFLSGLVRVASGVKGMSPVLDLITGALRGSKKR